MMATTPGKEPAANQQWVVKLAVSKQDLVIQGGD